MNIVIAKQNDDETFSGNLKMRISSVYGVSKKIHQNKKIFQLKASCPHANRCMGSLFGWESQVNTFEQVHVVGYPHVV